MISEARRLARTVPDKLALVGRLAADPSTPRRHRLLLLALVAYLASPIDLIPDFIPVLGQIDDAIAVVLVLRIVQRGRLDGPTDPSTLNA
ncbi:MAG TPA: DUF1232 domain-containing protein [Solirubrobacterales bacterium]|jgi:uncharacterized membrane protein YkvA (DUF1232 family)